MLSSEIPDLVSLAAGYPAAVPFASSRTCYLPWQVSSYTEMQKYGDTSEVPATVGPVTERSVVLRLRCRSTAWLCQSGVPPHPRFCFGESVDLAERGAMRNAATTSISGHIFSRTSSTRLPIRRSP